MPGHASRKGALRLVILGALLVVIGVALGVLGGALVGAPCAVLGLMLFALGMYTRETGAGVQVLNTAFNEASRGALGRAEALLDHAEATFKHGYILRVADLQRGMIAMRRGDIPGALARVTRSIDSPLNLLTRANERVHVASARGLRAVLRAAAGDEAGARVDIETVWKSVDALPDALGRAALAEAMLLEKSGDRAGLRALMARKKLLLLEHTGPRERAIVRAYQRMLEASPSSVYREAPRARDDEAREEPQLGDWVAKVAPGAAPFVPAASSTANGDAPALPVPGAAARGAAEARFTGAKHRPKARRSVAIWLAMVAASYGFWTLLDTGGTGRMDAEPLADSGSTFALIAGLGVALVVVLLGRQLVLAQRLTRELVAAIALSARGDEAGARSALEAIGRGKYKAMAASAHLHLAAMAERAGDLVGSLAACDAALACVATDAIRVTLSDIVLPEVLSQRAFVLAALDRADEAAAEMAYVEAALPAYPYLSRAKLRVGQVLCARRGDIEGVARLHEAAGQDMPLSARDESLGALARATVRPGAAGAGEIGRLRRELASDAGLRRWVSAVGPKVLEAFERAPEVEGAEGAEDEALGVEEAAAAERGPIRARG